MNEGRMLIFVREGFVRVVYRMKGRYFLAIPSFSLESLSVLSLSFDLDLTKDFKVISEVDFKLLMR